MSYTVILKNGEQVSTIYHLTMNSSDPKLMTHMAINYNGKVISLHYVPGPELVTEPGQFDAGSFSMMIWNAYNLVKATTPIGRAFSALMAARKLAVVMKKY